LAGWPGTSLATELWIPENIRGTHGKKFPNPSLANEFAGCAPSGVQSTRDSAALSRKKRVPKNAASASRLPPRLGRSAWLLGVLLVASTLGLARAPVTAATPARHSRDYFRHHMAATVRADHPAIVPVANAIRALTDQPLEQISIVNDVTHLLVDYDDDQRVWGAGEYHATLDEMLQRRRESGWLYLRDDCDGRAVFAAHLLAALGIPWRLEASYWKEHAWVVARVGGVDYDLLDLRRDSPEARRLSYRLIGHLFVSPSHRPPPFAWRRAWSERTRRDLSLGLQLGLLAVDSTPGHLHERYATDWTVRAPHGLTSPIEDRITSATIAGYPYGEPLNRGAVVAQVPAEVVPASGVTTGSASSASAETAETRN
jgi:hypothetical protein